MTEAHKRAHRYPKYKTSYRVKNWPEYEKSHRNRGDITVWLSRDTIDAWTPPKNGKRGGQLIYSDIAIETSLSLRLVFHREIDRFVGDRTYDQDMVYEAVDHHSPGAEVVVPPRKEAVFSNSSISVPSHRDRHIAEIRSKVRSEWKRQSGYYLQNHAENAFYRYKRIIGGRLRAKNDDAQKREAAIGCAILNRMREMGWPLSYAVG